MSELRLRAGTPEDPVLVVEVTPESAGWRYVGFACYRLDAGYNLARSEPERETCIVILSGQATVVAAGRRYHRLGKRKSVFEDIPPYAVYVPAGTAYTIEALTPAEVALCTAPGGDAHPVRLIEPSEISGESRGEGANQRFVRNILPETEPAASLLIAEVITPSGNWSSYPPHKHDADSIPEESALEEVYYHRLNPTQGFAFQRVYTDDRSLDETLSVHDGDLVLVPRGYHPVGVPYGYDLYYLNVMAGPKRTWLFRNDPAHEWILESA